MAYNIESLIQRGGAQVSLNIMGGELTVTLKAVDPTVEDAEAVAIDRELLRDMQATLSNNNYPTTGYCEITNGDNDGELVITAPSNMPLAEGENLIVLSGVYCGAMFVQTYSVTGVASGSTTASATITLNIIGSTPVGGGGDSLVTEGNEIADGRAFLYDKTIGAVTVGNAGENTRNGNVKASHTTGTVHVGTNANGSLASGYAQDGGEIYANGDGCIAAGFAEFAGTITASARGSIAVGYSGGSSEEMQSSGGYSQAFGWGTIARVNSQMAIGKKNVADENGDYALIVGNGDYDGRHNAFAIGWNGSLYLFQSDGTPIELTPAKLAALVA